MADLRLWSRDAIIDLLELYKSHQCLWDVKCEGYKSKYTRSFAYKELVQFCMKRGFPEANRDFVAKKIQSLRGSFRKELRKIEKYNASGRLYQTNLWYFNNLLFTKDAHDTTSDEHNQTDDDERTDGGYDDDDDDDGTKFSAGNSDVKITTPDPSPPHSPSPPPKRRKKQELCPPPEFLDIGQELAQDRSKYKSIDQEPSSDRSRSKDLKDLSEFGLVGLNVSKKLARMDEMQAIYAESLINNVIKRGLLKRLKEETDLCDNMCRRTRVHIPSQSNDN